MRLLHRIFKRAQWIDVVVDAALERQRVFEAEHPVETDEATRLAAVIGRAEQIAKEHGAWLIPRAKLAETIRKRLETT